MKAWASIDGFAVCIRVDVDGRTSLRLSPSEAQSLLHELRVAVQVDYPKMQRKMDAALGDC